MCIENEKCFNCISIKLAVVLICLFAIPEALFYWLTANITGMVIFPVLSCLVYMITLLMFKEQEKSRKIATIAYCLT